MCQVDLRRLEYRIESDEQVVYALEKPIELFVRRKDARRSELVVAMVRTNWLQIQVQYQRKHYQLLWYIEPALKTRSDRQQAAQRERKQRRRKEASRRRAEDRAKRTAAKERAKELEESMFPGCLSLQR